MCRYGISRIHLQQCGYVLADAQSVQNSIRHLLAAVRPDNIDATTKTK
jgi:meiotic recombination protein REC8, fungi type